MEKEVYFEDKRIVDISYIEKTSKNGNIRKIKIYVFDDGTFIRRIDTIGKKFKYVCEECGAEKYSTTKPEQTKTETYICPTCRGLNHNGFKGKHHTDEYKKKSSERMKGRYDGENNPMYGKSWKDYTTEDVIEKHNKKLSELFSGEKNPMYGKKIKDYMTPEKYEEWRQNVINNSYHSKPLSEQREISKRISEAQQKLMQNNPEYYKEIKRRGGIASISKQKHYIKSSIEIIVENWLSEHNISFDYSPIMGSGEKVYQYDFIIHNRHILIEVNGDYWHGNPIMFNEDGSDGKRMLNDIQKNKIKKDKSKYDFAINHGFDVIYIWETEINNGDFSKLNILL